MRFYVWKKSQAAAVLLGAMLLMLISGVWITALLDGQAEPENEAVAAFAEADLSFIVETPAPVVDTSLRVEIVKSTETPPLAGKKVLIYHTHTTESYQPDSFYDFTHTSPDRTTDTAYNVASVGQALATELERLEIETIHIKDLYDYPQYNNSYARSCEGVQAVLEENPDIKIVIDLHRDAITTKEGQKTKITANINGEKVAQVMLVVGTDELGLVHENWRTNLKFAADLQREFSKISPDFVRPINLRTSRFNGHVAPGAVIIEVGAAGNTLSEAKASTPHIAKALSEVIKNCLE